MNVTTITYKRLRSYGDYSNASLEATASVADGETPEQAIEALRALVETALEQQITVSRMTERVQELQELIDYNKTELAELQQKRAAVYEEVMALRSERHELRAEQQPVVIPASDYEDDDDDPPF